MLLANLALLRWQKNGNDQNGDGIDDNDKNEDGSDDDDDDKKVW